MELSDCGDLQDKCDFSCCWGGPCSDQCANSNLLGQCCLPGGDSGMGSGLDSGMWGSGDDSGSGYEDSGMGSGLDSGMEPEEPEDYEDSGMGSGLDSGMGPEEPETAEPTMSPTAEPTMSP